VLLYGLFAGLSVPYLIETRDPDARPRLSLPAWLITGCVVASVFRLLWGSPEIVWVVTLAGLLASLYGLGVLFGQSRGGWGRPFRTLGALGVGAGTVILSYREPWDELIESLLGLHHHAGFEAAAPTVFGALTVGLLLVGLSLFVGLRLSRHGRRYEAGLTLSVIPLTTALMLALVDGTFTASLLVVNAYGIGLGLLICVDGLRRGQLGTMNFGLLLVTAVLVARFFDVEWSFVVRGVAFVVLGLTFLGINLRARRKEVTA
jgi:hypothetical protein